MDGLNIGIIKNLPVDLSSIQYQQEVCVDIHQLERQTQNLQRHYFACLADVATLHQSLFQAAFSANRPDIQRHSPM